MWTLSLHKQQPCLAWTETVCFPGGSIAVSHVVWWRAGCSVVIPERYQTCLSGFPPRNAYTAGFKSSNIHFSVWFYRHFTCFITSEVWIYRQNKLAFPGRQALRATFFSPFFFECTFLTDAMLFLNLSCYLENKLLTHFNPLTVLVSDRQLEIKQNIGRQLCCWRDRFRESFLPYVMTVYNKSYFLTLFIVYEIFFCFYIDI